MLCGQTSLTKYGQKRNGREQGKSKQIRVTENKNPGAILWFRGAQQENETIATTLENKDESESSAQQWNLSYGFIYELPDNLTWTQIK